MTTGVLLYADTNVENPKIRLADITDVFQQVTVSNVRSLETMIQPGESELVVSTQRILGAGINTTVFEVLRPIETEDIARLSWTGVGSDPGFRSVRAIGVDNTTHMAMVRVGPRSMKLMSTSGSSFNTASILTGDQLWLERNTDTYTSPFSSFNTDKLFTIQSKGTGYIVINDEGTLGEEPDVFSVVGAFEVFVQPIASKPKIGDYIKIAAGSNFNYYNQGVFQILRITDTYIEFVNPYSVAETLTNSSNAIVIFDYFIRFAHLISSGELMISFDGSPGFVMEKLGEDHGQYTGTIKTTQITATNTTLSPVSLRCQFAGAIEG